jgi:hypothetical protein
MVVTGLRSEYNSGMFLVTFTSAILGPTLTSQQMSWSCACSLMKPYTWRSTTRCQDLAWDWTGQIWICITQHGMLQPHLLIFCCPHLNEDFCMDNMLDQMLTWLVFSDTTGRFRTHMSGYYLTLLRVSADCSYAVMNWMLHGRCSLLYWKSWKSERLVQSFILTAAAVQ